MTALQPLYGPAGSWWPSGWGCKSWFLQWRPRSDPSAGGTASARRSGKAARYTSAKEEKKNGASGTHTHCGRDLFHLRPIRLFRAAGTFWLRFQMGGGVTTESRHSEEKKNHSQAQCTAQSCTLLSFSDFSSVIASGQGNVSKQSARFMLQNAGCSEYLLPVNPVREASQVLRAVPKGTEWGYSI